MITNLGRSDRLIRLLLAILCFYRGLFVHSGSALGVGLLILGSLSCITGLLGFCGLYSLLGIRTRPTKQQPE